jgi:hypothetical protein
MSSHIYVAVYYVLQDAILMHPTKVAAARAANVTYVMLQYRRELDREELNPVCITCF